MAGGLGSINPNLIPAFNVTPQEQNKRGWFSAGVSAGTDELQGLLGSAAQGIGKMAGFQPLEDYGRGVAERNAIEAQQNGRADLEIAPWKEGGASVLPWLGYQTAKQVPQLAAWAIGSALAPEAVVPAGLARAGAVLPRFLGGGALEAGAGFAARRAAVEEGQSFAKKLVTGMAIGTPLGFGSMYQEADSKPGGATAADAVKALALSPFYAAPDSLELGILGGLAKGALKDAVTGGIKAGAKSAAKQVLKAGLIGAAEEFPTEGIQTAMEVSFRPDMSQQDKMSAIVDAAVTGAAVGGTMGGLAGGIGTLRSVRKADPAALTTEALDQITAAALQPQQPQQASQPEQQMDLPLQPQANMFPAGYQFDLEGRNQTYDDLAKAQTSVLANVPTAEIQTALSSVSEGTDPAVVKALTDELERRKTVNSSSTETMAASDPVGAVERQAGGGPQGGAEQNSAAPAPTPTEILKGISTRKAYAGAATVEEVAAKLRERLAAGSSAAGDFKLAERLGIDTNEPAAPLETTSQSAQDQTQSPALEGAVIEPTQWADYVELRPGEKAPPGFRVVGEDTEPAAPANQGGGDQSVDPDFRKAWKSELTDRKGVAFSALRKANPGNLQEAKAAIYDVLAGGPEAKSLNARDGYAEVEGLAKKYGLLNEDGTWTQDAQQIERGRMALQDASSAGQEQGYKGALLSAFTSGATGQNYTPKNEAAARAYEAGKAWTAPQAAPDTSTEVTLGRIGRGEVPAQAQVAQQANSLVDKYAKREDDVAQLKRMISDGNYAGVIEGLQRVRRGEPLFQEAAAQPRNPADFKGERVDATSRALRGVKGKARDRLAYERDMDSQSKRYTRAEAEQAIQHYQLTQSINAAVESGAIDRKEQLRLTAKLRQGKYAEVANAVPVIDAPSAAQIGPSLQKRIAQRRALVADLQEALIAAEREAEVQAQELTVDSNGLLAKNQVKASRREFLAGVGAALAVTAAPVRSAGINFTPASQTLEARVNAGNPVDVLEHLKSNSSDPSYRMIAAKLSRGDWSRVRLALRDESEELRGKSTVNDDGTITIEFFGQPGMNEQTILHEMIHAYVQLRWSGLSTYMDSNKRLLNDTTDRNDAVIRSFQGLWMQIGEAIKTKHPDMINDEIWAQQVYSDPDEMLSWVLTNPDAQAFFKTVDSDGKPIAPKKAESEKTLWDKIIDFFAGIFGGGQRVKSALDDILAAGYAVLDAGVNVSTNDFAPKIAAKLKEQNNSMPMLRTPAAYNDRAKQVISAVNKLGNGIINSESGFRDSTFDNTVGWMHATHLAEMYGKVMPGLVKWETAQSNRRATTSVLAHLSTQVMNEMGKLASSNKARFDDLMRIMEGTAYGYDPTVPWDSKGAGRDNSHLHEADNEAELKALHARDYQRYNLLKKEGLSRHYDELRQLNEMDQYASMAMGLQALLHTDPTLMREIGGPFSADKMAEFRNNADYHDPSAARAFWLNALISEDPTNPGYLKAFDDHMASLGTDISSRDAANRNARLKPVQEYAKKIRDSITSIQQAPYFHLGRFGNHFISMHVRLGEDKKVDRAALEHVAKELEKAGATEVRITKELGRSEIFIRAETKEELLMLEAAAKQLQAGGWLSEDLPVKAGPRANEQWLPQRSREQVKRLLEAIKSDEFFNTDGLSDERKADIEQLKERAVNAVYDAWLNLLPDTATVKVLTHREGKPGFSTDMLRAFAHRYNITVNTLSNMASEPHISEAFEDMRRQAMQAREVDNPNHQSAYRMQTILEEMLKREVQREGNENIDAIDTWRAFAHTFYLGLSPSYVAVNMTQVGVLLWPELAKKNSFVDSAKAIGNVTPLAFNIMRETMASAFKTGGLLAAADGVISREVIAKLAPNKQTANFLQRIIGSGLIDIGSAARELAQLSEKGDKSRVSNGLKLAAATGLYSETFTRLIAALSAYKLSKGSEDERFEYAKSVVRQSMLEYSTWNNARLMGKMGIAGRFTPVMMTFMQYTAQVTQKLYREVYHAFSANATEAEKKEARRFLTSHLTMVTALAGTLGMPFATAAAWAVEKLVDAFDDDDEPYDATAAWRNFMADVFGKDIGEMVSRGVFRGAGFDVSQRIGEQNLLPFSQFLTDKREWKDAAADLAMRSTGAPTSMAFSLIDGAGKISDGDLMGGLAAMMPAAIKGPVQAFRMTNEGYVDTKGNKIPIEPKAGAILAQLLGFTPAEKAEYSEARSEQLGRSTQIRRDATVLRNRIVNAVLEGDMDKAKEYVRKARKFDNDNPAFAVLPDIEASLTRRRRAQAQAQVTGAPIGVSQKDLDALRMTRYANVEYRAQ